jgi:hypothetical protein
MKPGSIVGPWYYMGSKLKKMVLPNGVVAWRMISGNYIQAAVENVQYYWETNFGGRNLLKISATPFSMRYCTEVDYSPEVNPEMVNCHFNCRL